MGVRRVTTHEPYIVAAHVTGNITPDAGTVPDGQRRRTTPRRDDTAKDAMRQAAMPRTAMHGEGRRQGEAGRGRCAGRQGAGEDEDRCRAGGRHRLDRADHLPAPRDGPGPGFDHRFQIPERGVRAQHSRLVRRGRSVRRSAEADAIASHFDESRRSDRGAAEGLARRAAKFVSDARQQIEAAQDEFRKKMAELGKPQGSGPARERADDGARANSPGADCATCGSPRSKRSETRR